MSAAKNATRFFDWIIRSAGVAFAAGVIGMAAPLLDTALDRRSHLEPSVHRPETTSRIAVKLGRGDTLLSILTRFGLNALSAQQLVNTIRPLVSLRALQPGSSVQLLLDNQGRSVQGMEISADTALVRATSTQHGWMVERREIPFVREPRAIRSVIAGSLYQSGVQAGLVPTQIHELARIFEYDVDFFSDFKPGDRFAVLVEQRRYIDGRASLGQILAARIEPNGEPHEAFYFAATGKRGAFYGNDGRAVQRSFLRAPLSYVRISSPFSAAREDPISRTVRPHQAIDYAAPVGTPVVAIGQGHIEFAGWETGYGNLVEIRHANGYSSRYGHFSRIAPGIQKGAVVETGQIIGYVGQTGEATGPHLHFEFLKSGEKINFLSLKTGGIDRLQGADLQSFMRTRDQHLARLNGTGNSVARAGAGL
jgi:murein DD-endopeptidase MepM/ murein hydrolase activator NlpD